MKPTKVYRPLVSIMHNRSTREKGRAGQYTRCLIEHLLQVNVVHGPNTQVDWKWLLKHMYGNRDLPWGFFIHALIHPFSHFLFTCPGQGHSSKTARRAAQTSLHAISILQLLLCVSSGEMRHPASSVSLLRPRLSSAGWTREQQQWQHLRSWNKQMFAFDALILNDFDN